MPRIKDHPSFQTSPRSLTTLLIHPSPLNITRAIMACPRCRLRFSLSQTRSEIRIPRRRAFHTTPSRQKLGAFTYPQEWQTGTYHFNKATQKTFPVATLQTDRLLNQWLTQQKKRSVSDSAAYQLMLRGSIAAQRRQSDRTFVSKSTVKDFGDRIEVNAFVYDAAEAAANEANKRMKARMGTKPQGGEGGDRRRRPTRLRALGGGDASGSVGGAGGAGRTPGPRRFGGTNANTVGGTGRRPGPGRFGRPSADGAGGSARTPTPRSFGGSNPGASGVVFRKLDMSGAGAARAGAQARAPTRSPAPPSSPPRRSP